jgi:hypothetical protein
MNNNIEPHYVDFNTAKWLKEKGFIEPTLTYWSKRDGLIENEITLRNHNGRGEWGTSRPEQHVVVEWLRVNHGIHIGIDAWLQEDGSNQGYDYCVYKTWKDKIDYELKLLNSSTQIKLYNTPQSAYAAAFDYIKDNNLI